MSTGHKSTPDRSSEDFGLRHRLLAWRVLSLLNLTQRSATPAYRRATGLSDGEWRIVYQVGIHAPVSLVQLAALLRRDKSQVSRTVGGLVTRGVLARLSRRALLDLSSRGRNLFSRILRLAEARNRTLIQGLSDVQLKRLRSMMARLQGQARRLIAASQLQACSTVESRQALVAARLTDRAGLLETDVKPRDRLILPDFINLLNLLRSSSTAVFRRATGMPEFEWQIVSQVGEHGILTLIELVSNMERDNSQVGRAVKRLVRQGHLLAYQIGRARHIRLVITPSGRRIYERAARLALARNARLVRDLSREEERILFAILDRLTDNAADLLSRPRTRGS